MPTVPLPDRPNLGQLRNQAKDLQRSVRAGIPDALAEVAERHPVGVGADGSDGFSLSDAQLVVARRYGFSSWTPLKRYVEVVERYSRYPADLAQGAGPGRLADEFLRLACLTYGDDDRPEPRRRARDLLSERPELTEDDIFVAAAAADADAVGRLLATDPAAAMREGGPYRWTPLLYLAYARHDPDVARDAVLAAARLLLDAGADVDAGYLWHGMPSPFTVLTGVFGEGELGPIRQPRHPHSIDLARLLLDAGADPNDGQALYNRMFGRDNDHLEVLFEFGLGTGAGGPWHRRLGAAIDTPEQMVRGQLRWAVSHGMAERVGLLLDHGVDAAAPFADGITATALAATSGHAALVDDLVAHGAPAPTLEPVDAFIAAALAADRTELDRVQTAHPGVAAAARTARPALVVWAAGSGNAPAVELLVAAGFDVNARGRTDVPVEQPWHTALHGAAESGDVELARTLLRLGADPDIHDERFDATPLGWARYLDHPDVADLLEAVTAEGDY
jgi:ankyrin repeat protein